MGWLMEHRGVGLKGWLGMYLFQGFNGANSDETISGLFNCLGNHVSRLSLTLSMNDIHLMFLLSLQPLASQTKK
jgi:hypothetical protein